MATGAAAAAAACLKKFEEDAKNERLCLNDFVILKKIGEGGEGCVYHAKHKESGFDEIALKQVYRDLGESTIHGQMDHPNIVRMHGMFRSEDVKGEVWLILEYCPEGTVMDVIANAWYDGVWDDDDDDDEESVEERDDNNAAEEPKDEEESPLGTSKESFLAKVVRSILHSMKYMQQQNVLHADIKPANMLWKNGIAKLADFGIATKLIDDDSSTTPRPNKVFGTVPFMAPEALEMAREIKLREMNQEDEYDETNENQEHDDETFGVYDMHKAELWSLGVSIFEMAYGFADCFPFPFKPKGDLTEELLGYLETNTNFDASRIEFPEDCSDDLKQFILALLHTNPDKRLSIDEALQHPWILRHTTTTTTPTASRDLPSVADDKENTNHHQVEGKTTTTSKEDASSDESIKAETNTLEEALHRLDLNMA